MRSILVSSPQPDSDFPEELDKTIVLFDEPIIKIRKLNTFQDSSLKKSKASSSAKQSSKAIKISFSSSDENEETLLPSMQSVKFDASKGPSEVIDLSKTIPSDCDNRTASLSFSLYKSSRPSRSKSNRRDNFDAPDSLTVAKEHKLTSTKPSKGSLLAHTRKFSFILDSETTGGTFSGPSDQKLAPSRPADLAVHPRRVQSVRQWLISATGPNDTMSNNVTKQAAPSKMLILSGPAGSGKTTTVQTLAKELDIEVVEWVNPIDQRSFHSRNEFSAPLNDSIPIESGSLMRQFLEFIRRSQRFSQLSFQTTNGKEYSRQGNRKRIILVEDLPNLYHDENRHMFHDLLKDVLSPTSHFVVPIVFIISDNFAGKQSDLYDFFPRSIVSLPSAPLLLIQFNPIANTFIKKALERVVKLIVNHGKSRLLYDKEIIQLIVESSYGDVRSAINALFWLNLLEQQQGFYTKGEILKALQCIGREPTTVLFHALGKILYNKPEENELKTRIEEETKISENRKVGLRQQKLGHANTNMKEELSSLVDHLIPSKSSPELLVMSTHTTNEAFILYLHQNYIDFLPAADYAQKKDCLRELLPLMTVAQCAELFSFSDWSRQGDFFSSSLTANRNHHQSFVSHHEDNYSISIATRGYLVATKQEYSATKFDILRERYELSRLGDDDLFDNANELTLSSPFSSRSQDRQTRATKNKQRHQHMSNLSVDTHSLSKFRQATKPFYYTFLRNRREREKEILTLIENIYPGSSNCLFRQEILPFLLSLNSMTNKGRTRLLALIMKIKDNFNVSHDNIFDMLKRLTSKGMYENKINEMDQKKAILTSELVDEINIGGDVFILSEREEEEIAFSGPLEKLGKHRLEQSDKEEIDDKMELKECDDIEDFDD